MAAVDWHKQRAVGQNPNRTPSEHPYPATKIGRLKWVVNSPTNQKGIPLVLTTTAKSVQSVRWPLPLNIKSRKSPLTMGCRAPRFASCDSLNIRNQQTKMNPSRQGIHKLFNPSSTGCLVTTPTCCAVRCQPSTRLPCTESQTTSKRSSLKLGPPVERLE